LGERLLCKQEVVGSIPITSTMGTSTMGTSTMGTSTMGTSTMGTSTTVATPAATSRQAKHGFAERHHRRFGEAANSVAVTATRVLIEG
jgi:hypothetical protein